MADPMICPEMRLAFTQDIIDHPDDDTPRLIFADWLEENEEPEWAALIRLQCLIGETPEVDRHTELRLHCLEFDVCHKAFFPVDKPGPWTWTSRRGFVDSVSTTMESWLKHGPEVCKWQPIRKVEIRDREPYRCPPVSGLVMFGWGPETGLVGVYEDSLLPRGLFEFLGEAGQVHVSSESAWSQTWKWYETELQATEALSTGCIQWARRNT